MAKLTSIQKRRRLQELYVKGTEVRFNEDGVNKGEARDDDIVVWLQPPSPLQREQAVREAQAEKARATLNARKKEDSADGAEIRAFLASMKLDTLIDYVLESGESERRQEAMREVLRREEWENFTELQDMVRRWDEAGNPETEEWQPLIEKDRLYGEQVSAEAKRLREDARESLSMLPREELERRAFDKRIDIVGTQAFMLTYERQMLFYACRDSDDHRQLFFESAEEMAEMDDLVQMTLADTLATFIEDQGEAKNSPRGEGGSEQSTPPAEQETSAASTPRVANA